MSNPPGLLETVAARMGCPLERLQAAAVSRELIYDTPGYLTDGEKPIPIGSIVNLKRETIPGYPLNPKDARWIVAGYTRMKGGERWRGHVMTRGTFSVERALLSKFEAYDLVEEYGGAETK